MKISEWLIVNRENLILKYLKWSFINLLFNFNPSKIKLSTNFIVFTSPPPPEWSWMEAVSIFKSMIQTVTEKCISSKYLSPPTPSCGASGLWQWIPRKGQPWWADAFLHREALEKIHSIWISDSAEMSPEQCMWQREQNRSVHSRSKRGSVLNHYQQNRKHASEQSQDTSCFYFKDNNEYSRSWTRAYQSLFRVLVGSLDTVITSYRGTRKV